MKAVPVLLCLALAHGISASIFKHVDNLDVQPLEYIDQQQRQHRNQPSESEKQRYYQREQLDQKRTHQQGLQSSEERSQLLSRQGDQHPDQQREQRHHKIQWQQSEESKDREQSQYPQPEQYQSKHKQKTSYRHSRASSSESSQSSQESHENRHHKENVKSRSNIHIQKWTPDDTFESQENQQTVYGDVFVRKGARMSVGPSVTVQEKEEFEKIFGNAQEAMNQVSDEVKEQFHTNYQLIKQQENEDTELNFTQLAQQHQYPVEEHKIKTDDGYELTVFRIPPKMHTRDVQKRPVVFLMHGIDGSADDWVLMGPRKSLAYLLSDAGYDVWLGNARGNKYSMQHVSKHPAVSDFWQYSIDEIALHDLPAMIDHALKTTQQEKLYYIGHSQGTTAFFALTATRPEYNDKIIMMYALSPMVFMSNVRSPLFRMIAPTSNFYTRLQQQLGNGPFKPNKEMIQAIGGDILEKLIGCKEVSSNVNFVMAGVNLDGLEPQVMAAVMRHLPAGTSTKVIKQYGQGVAWQDFRMFDYGPKINEKVYGNEQPPKYDMEKVQAPVTLYYSEEDWLAHPKDVERLEQELPNVKETHKVTDEHFSNMDFQFSTKAPEMVYRRLIESMENNQ